MAGNGESTKTYEGGTCKNKTASRNHGNTLTQRITKTHRGKRGNVKKHRNTTLRNKLKTTVLFIFYMHFVHTLSFYCFFSVWAAKCVTAKSKTDFRKGAIKCIVLYHIIKYNTKNKDIN